MITFLIIIHVIVSISLIGIILIQGGKGAQLGAAFGGSSQTLFGSRGAATFLGKMTTVVAVVFMLTSLTLAVFTAKGGGSVVKKTPVTEERQAIPAPPMPDQPSEEQQQTPQQPAQETKK
jgi:preprotein translocase subunit SecG